MKYLFALLTVSFAGAEWSLMAAEKKIDIGKVDASKLPPAADKKDVTYAKDIRPILEVSCVRCHGEEKHKGKLRLVSLKPCSREERTAKWWFPAAARKVCSCLRSRRLTTRLSCRPSADRADVAARKGRMVSSVAMGEIRPPDGETNPPGQGASGPRQPPGGAGAPGGGFGPPAKPLTAEQVELIRAWVDQGAK